MATEPVFNMIAKTLAGLEPVLAGELKALGATGIREIKRAVAFDGDHRLLYRANYELRSALRILVPIHEFPVYHEKNLYDGIREIDWSKYMSVDDTLAIDAVTRGEVFRHSQYAGQLTKDAIVDQFRERLRRRPSVNTVAPTLRVNIHIQGTHCDVAIDASGDSLHRRNYRRDTVEAPLNEVLAAGMILLSGWNGRGNFADPMCGSGTLPIEAAFIATNTPVQIKRAGFGFFKWPDFDRKLWQSVVENANDNIQPFDFQIFASDKDPRARNATSINVLSAGLEDLIKIDKIAFDKLVPPELPGTLIANPPYDERLKLEDTAAFYKGIGDRLKKSWTGWDAWLISSNREALKNIGLRPSRKITLFNGALECSFQKFDLYEGSKK
ncbi:MAG: class I SAM-dependent RNA methyltransferase [Saprospiraceae bacterium]|nr:class I SAM-dependent RNA methyltransferase [Saprospiraceae bacterium]MCB0544033.1 class I SAM-dependent RNA methyltransferase [Saprospiraceae bacterium]